MVCIAIAFERFAGMLKGLSHPSEEGKRFDSLWEVAGWEGYRESRRCSRDTYPESYITKYTGIRRSRACS